MRRTPFIILLFLLTTNGCGQRGPGPEATTPGQTDVAPIHATGLHNVFRITDRLYSGSSPEGDAGFRSLQQLGVRTVISVDGARPDVERARRFDLRYVHLPIGYDGVPREQALRIARAVRDLPGPIYLHCHHGKHRGPAAAAVVHLCLDEKCPIETAVAEMRRAGTDPRYTGLYAAPGELRRPTAAELDQVSADFPEVAPVPALATAMVHIDDRWDLIKKIRAAAWKVPKDHPDLDPAHEALQLAEHYRESGRLPAVTDRPDDFRRWIDDSIRAAAELERALRPMTAQAAPDVAAAERAYESLHNACVRCHARYRDVPQKP